MFTHKELVDKAYKWAKGRHGLVIREKGGVYENPDILAFSWAFSTLIEVKANKADFLREKRKLPRLNGDYCVGNFRIYCAPKGLLTEDDIPDTWGLLEVYPSGFVKLKTNVYQCGYGAGNIWWHELSQEAHRAEKRMLYNAYLHAYLLGNEEKKGIK